MSVPPVDTQPFLTDQKAWRIAWPISLAVHGLGFLLLYFLLVPAGNPLAQSNTIRQMRLVEPPVPLEDEPVIHAESASALASLLQPPVTKPDIQLPDPRGQLEAGPSVIGLSGASESQTTLAAFSTAPRLSAPQVTFFGSSAAGYKVVFVVDRSGSMWDRFDMVRDELLAALARLEPSQQFQLIFFSSGSPLLIKPGNLLPASSANRRAAYDFLQQIAKLDPVSGSTDPSPALQTALNIAPGPPDLIFLLSDGDFPPEVIETVRLADPQVHTRINTIGFGYRGGAELLRSLAQANRGSFRFVSDAEPITQDHRPLDQILK